MQQRAPRQQPPPVPPEVANRRAGRRQAVQLRINILPLLDAARRLVRSRPRTGISLDLNEHGMLCCRVGYLPVGGVVRLFMRLPDRPEQLLACNARVMRCDLVSQPSYGLRFIDLPPSDALRLRSYAESFRHAGHAISWMYRFDA